MRHPTSVSLLFFVLSIAPSIVRADWKTDVGWYDLEEWAGFNGQTIPTSEDVFAGMVEAEQGEDNLSIYMANPGDAQFKDAEGEPDVAINDVYGETLTYSNHATTVAKLFFGNSSSISPTITEVNAYGANRFLDALLDYSSNWSEEVMSHAYIGSFSNTVDAETQEVTETKQEKSEKYCRAFDWSASVANILHISGANNGTSTNLPHLWSHAYNNITVGRSDGKHSAGTVQNGYHGSNRQKPELVCPQSTTSSSTGATSSIASVLRARAEGHDSSNATHNLTLKSILLAGACKQPFPQWSNSENSPIDSVYGAGEVNILNSFRILNADESTINSLVDYYGWDHHTLNDSAAVNYSFIVPDYVTSASISANLSWHRSVTRTRVQGQYTGSYDELANLSLTLRDSSNTIVFTSDSSVDNLEHIWLPQLEPDTYTLSVQKSSGPDTPYVIAWRVDLETNLPPTSFTQGPTTNEIIYSNLIPEHRYILQRSSDLNTWTNVLDPPGYATSDSDGSLNFSEPNEGLNGNSFYRLRYYSP